MRDNYIVTVNWRVDSLEGEGGGGEHGGEGWIQCFVMQLKRLHDCTDSEKIMK